MPNTFLISDTHFGHANICKFSRQDGLTKLRPWDAPEEMDEALVAAWNAVVGPKDKVYHLGDVAINRKCLATVSRLNGDKVLIRGNHDIFKDADYSPYFRSLRGSHVLDNFLLTHIPVHPESLGRFGRNIHGHLHDRCVKKIRGVDVKTGTLLYSSENDDRYVSVCVEHLANWAPVAFDEIRLAYQPK